MAWAHFRDKAAHGEAASTKDKVMKTGIVLAATLAVFASTAIGTETPSSAVVAVSWNISLDAEGHVTRIATDDKRMPKLHARLESAIRGWRFSPGKINGQATATDTRLRISLVDNGFEVRVLRASTGGGYRSTIAPHYPEHALKQHKQACVALKVQYDELGNVLAATEYDGIAKADRQFVEAALSSVKQWTFEPEIVGGHPIASNALVPITFNLKGMQEPECRWIASATYPDFDGGGAVALNPATKLESDVVGHTL
jgi:TonB family protein